MYIPAPPGDSGGKRNKVIDPFPFIAPMTHQEGPRPREDSTETEDCHTNTHVHTHTYTNTPIFPTSVLKFWLLGSHVSVIHSPSQRGGRRLVGGSALVSHQVAVPMLREQVLMGKQVLGRICPNRAGAHAMSLR